MTTINDVRELLENLVAREKESIREFESSGYKLTHGPTIGDIYEGISYKLVSTSLPDELDLRVVDGFVCGADKVLSPQIDCMIVRGEGISIPSITALVYPVERVLAVIEVKKSLHRAEIEDSLQKFDKLMKLELPTDFTLDADFVFDVFAKITGVAPKSFAEASNLPFELSSLFHSLVAEHSHPLKICLSYDGFKSEYAFRESVVEMMREKMGAKWYPIAHLPDLIISGGFSMIKLNGRPYSSRTKGEFYDLFGTSSVSVFKILLELIYTRISQDVSVPSFWGEDLEQEAIVPFLQTKPIQNGDVLGWEYNYVNFAKEAFRDCLEVDEWRPFLTEDIQLAKVLGRMCIETEGIKKSELEEFFGDNFDSKIALIMSTDLVALQGENYVLTTRQALGGFLGAMFFFGENNTGRLERWLINETKKRSSVYFDESNAPADGHQ